MIREISALEVRRNLGEILNEVKYRHDHVLITKTGKPVAALIDIDLFERLSLMKTKFKALTMDLEAVFEGVDPDTAQSEIEDALNAAKAR